MDGNIIVSMAATAVTRGILDSRTRSKSIVADVADKILQTAISWTLI